jgi:hypothetical protein
MAIHGNVFSGKYTGERSAMKLPAAFRPFWLPGGVEKNVGLAPMRDLARRHLMSIGSGMSPDLISGSALEQFLAMTLISAF